jgi:hypothetical protein
MLTGLQNRWDLYFWSRSVEVTIFELRAMENLRIRYPTDLQSLYY